MWKLPILFPGSHPAFLQYLGNDGNRVPHFLGAHCSVRGFIQCGVWHLPQFPCGLTCCQGVRIGSHVYCLPITSNIINSMKCLSEGLSMCLNTIKLPDRPWQTHNSVFFFKFPHGARVTSIPEQISTSLATLFHNSHKRLASRHISGDTLWQQNKFSVAVWGNFLFFKWAFATEHSLFRKLALLLGHFSPPKNDWLTDGSCRHRECMRPSSSDMLTPVKLIGGCSMTSRSCEFGEYGEGECASHQNKVKSTAILSTHIFRLIN
jgi:hypothetical protein